MLAEQPLVTLLIPVYYEQDNIVPLFEQIREYVTVPHVCIVVYDSQDDPTLLRRDDVLAIDPDARFVKNAFGKGIINAMKTGFAAASTPYIVPLMADLSDSPATVDKMYAKILEGYDLVVASRYVKGGRKIGGPLLKYILSRLANTTLHHLSGLPIHDMTNAFIIHKKSILDQISIRSQGGFEFTMEIIAKTYVLGYKLAEVPTTNRDRNSGASNFKLWSWIVHYLYWYVYILVYSISNRVNEHYVRDVRHR
ncbi:MAG: glycosyltransferase [Chloroflexi bacterium]|nr:glycosyltransferase [Chloroflexota bacterium]